MRKIVTVLLLIMMITSTTMFATAMAPNQDDNQGKENKDIIEQQDLVTDDIDSLNETVMQNVYGITISTLDIVQEIIYGWDLDAQLFADNSGKKTSSTTGTLQIQAERYVDSNDLKLYIEAEIEEDITVNTLTIELGDKVDDKFQGLISKEISDFDTVINEGITTIIIESTIDISELNDSQLSLINKVKVSIDGDKKNGRGLLTDTSPLIFPIIPKTVNSEVVIETNLLNVLKDIGTADVEVDDWYINERKLDEDNIFEKVVHITFDEIQNSKDIVVLVELMGDNNRILDSLKVSMTVEESGLLRNIWDGEVHHVHGFWMPPITEDFELEKRSVAVKFWLEQTPNESPNLYIFEADYDKDGSFSIGNLIHSFTENELRIGKCGRHSKNWGGNGTDGYYKYMLKARELPFLESGEDYVLAVMIGDKLLVFNEDNPAILTFSVAKDTLNIKGASQYSIKKSSINQTLKRMGPNRAK